MTGGVPCARYQSVAEAMDSPYAAARVAGLGEHGPAVFEQVLGRSPTEVARLIAEGVLCRPD